MIIKLLASKPTKLYQTGLKWPVIAILQTLLAEPSELALLKRQLAQKKGIRKMKQFFDFLLEAAFQIRISDRTVKQPLGKIGSNQSPLLNGKLD